MYFSRVLPTFIAINTTKKDMKILKQIALLAIMLFAQTTLAQDVLITKEGDVLKVFETEISNSYVFYKTSATADADIKRVAKSDLLMIKYSDGRKLVIDEENTSQPAAKPATQPAEATPQVVDYSDDTANTAAIDYYNSIDVQYLDAASSKKANFLYCLCKLNPQSKIADKNVEIKFKSFRNSEFSYYPCHNSVKVSIKNKSTETVYVDLGKSFLIRGSESMQCYVPSATSHTSGQSIGTSVNMGAVANAVGVSGALGTLASGVNVGGGKSSSATTTTFAQRVVPVPPMAEKEIGVLELFPIQNIDIYNLNYKVNSAQTNSLYLFLDKIPHIGENILLNDENLMRFGTFVTYSMDEQQSNPQSLNANFNLNNIIGTKAQKFLGGGFFKSEALSSNWEDAVYFFAYPKEDK